MFVTRLRLRKTHFRRRSSKLFDLNGRYFHVKKSNERKRTDGEEKLISFISIGEKRSKLKKMNRGWKDSIPRIVQ